MTSTVAPIDVNQQFYAEQRDRIDSQIQSAADAASRAERQLADFQARVESGEMRDLGNGRFEAITGWDRGEQWTVQTNPQGQTLVLPQHGLATDANGKASLYSRVPTWHELGTVVDSGLSSVEAVLEASGLNYVVVKRPVYDRMRDGTFQAHPDAFLTVREDTEQIKGVVGKGYTVIQQAQQFAWLEELVHLTSGSDAPVVWESAGELANGKTFVSLQLGNDIIIDVEGIADPISPFLASINSHDGKSSYWNRISPWRPVCGNTERMSARDAVTSWSTAHTSGVADRIGAAQETLRLTSEYFKAFQAEQEALARSEISNAEALALIARWSEEFWPEDHDTTSVRTRNSQRRRFDSLVKVYEENVEELGNTGYATERAITQWLDWESGVRVPRTLTEAVVRANKVIDGTNDAKKSRAHEMLMLRTR